LDFSSNNESGMRCLIALVTVCYCCISL